MTGLAGGIAVRSALGGAGAFFRRISPRAWLIIGCAVAAAVGFLVHQHAAHKAINDAYQHGRIDEARHVEQVAKALKIKFDRRIAAITTAERKKNDEKNAHIAGVARDVLVRGPGKAVCPGNSGPAPAADRHVQAPAETGNAVASVPDSGGQQLIALPFAPTVELVKQHDQCLVDLQSIEDQHDKLLEKWPKSER